MYAAPLQDALKAALDLTDKRGELDEGWPLWFYLAAVASADAGLVDRDMFWEQLGNRAEGSAALELYASAKSRLRSRAFA